jgi:hypothetical protein
VSPPPFDALSAWGIALIALVMAAAFVWLLSRGHSSRAYLPALSIAAVMAASAALARTGVLQRSDLRPPPMFLLIVAMLAMGIALGLSPLARRAAEATSLTTLVGLQAFRLPLELVMHRAADRGIMPPELSFSGYNFDILTGAGALALYVIFTLRGSESRLAIGVWNAWGLWCLTVIVLIAVATSPVVRLFGDDPRHVNTWVLFFPYVWLPVVLVTVAVAGHVMITRRLLHAAA